MSSVRIRLPYDIGYSSVGRALVCFRFYNCHTKAMVVVPSNLGNKITWRIVFGDIASTL